jgi:hypothetical protein
MFQRQLSKPPVSSHVSEVCHQKLTQVEGGASRTLSASQTDTRQLNPSIQAILDVGLCHYTGSDVGFPHLG